MTAELRLDPVRCDGHAICAFLIGERVDLDAWGYPHVDRTPITDADMLRRARRAVRACPQRALVLEERPEPLHAVTVQP